MEIQVKEDSCWGSAMYVEELGGDRGTPVGEANAKEMAIVSLE